MNWQQSFVAGLLLGAGFCAVQLAAGVLLPRPELAAQGARGPVNAPPPSPLPTPPIAIPPGGTVPPPAAAPIVYSEESGQAAVGNGFLAVTGSYGVGTSVLYLVDTKSRQLAVYEARGGSAEQRRIVFVGARKIDLDLQLEAYNDRSEYEYRRLRKLFENRDSKDPDVSTGLEPGGSTRK
jgi:hypothetical protein